MSNPLKHIVRSLLFAFFGSFAGLVRTDESFRMALVGVELPLGLTGVFPLPLVLGRTSEQLGRPMTVAGPRNWDEKVQSFLLRPAFGLEAIQAYREVQAEERKARAKARRKRLRELLNQLVGGGYISEVTRVKVEGQMHSTPIRRLPNVRGGNAHISFLRHLESEKGALHGERRELSAEEKRELEKAAQL